MLLSRPAARVEIRGAKSGMRMLLKSWIRGIWQLRDPELIRWLGVVRQDLRRMQRIRAACPAATIDGDVLIQGWPEGSMTLAPGVRIEKGSIIALGDPLNGYGSLEIGESTWVGQYNNLRLAARSRIIIGKQCMISQFCSLVAANHRLDRGASMQSMPSDQERTGVTIGDDVWLGAGVSVMPGCVIGSGAVVGANSVIRHEVPPFEIWAGVPARKIGERR